MKLSELSPGEKLYTQLSCTTLAVLNRRVDGWCVYIGGVPGLNHEFEWKQIMRRGDKTIEPIARAIVENLFHPNFEVDLPYAS